MHRYKENKVKCKYLKFVLKTKIYSKTGVAKRLTNMPRHSLFYLQQNQNLNPGYWDPFHEKKFHSS